MGFWGEKLQIWVSFIGSEECKEKLSNGLLRSYREINKTASFCGKMSGRKLTG